MDIFMSNIDYSLAKDMVETRLAKILNDPRGSFSKEQPIAFYVHLFKSPDSAKKNKGIGILSLPTEQLGQRFLEVYGSDPPRTPLTIGARTIIFTKSTKPMRNDIATKLGLPQNENKQGKFREERHADNVQMKVLQFGWFCRDLAFSVEAEEHCDDRCFVTFRNRREICIDLRHQHGTYLIVMAYSSINAISVSTVQGEHVLVFDLVTPPSYEKLQEGGQLRLKQTFLPIPGHDRVAPYVSLAIRLVCASDAGLRNFRHLCKTAHYKVNSHKYVVVHRDLFSAQVMSEVQSSLEQLDWVVAFQIESLLRSRSIDFREALQLLPVVTESIQRNGKETTAAAIRAFKIKAAIMFAEAKINNKPDDQFNVPVLFKKLIAEVHCQGNFTSLRPTDGSLYQSLHVKVTPTTMYLDGPILEQSNRVLRAYAENQESFLRVTFLDETGHRFQFGHEIDGPTYVAFRIKPMLYDGLKIAGRKFEFLAYSLSALKEHSVWFVKPFNDPVSCKTLINAGIIITNLGNFGNLKFDRNLMYYPARYGARLSQAFTATDAVKVEINDLVVLEDKDICTPDGKYQFTDGVGSISRELSQRIWLQLRKIRRQRPHTTPPSAYQMRFQGSKGMVCVDHTLPGSVIRLRPSMIKFHAPETTQDIEIAQAFYRPRFYFLNRPLVMLLEGLGVDYSVFKHHQDMAVEATNMVTLSLTNAATLMENYGLGTVYMIPSMLRSLEKLGINLSSDDFYVNTRELAVHHVRRDLKYRARILIPGAWTLVGVADAHRYLEPNQIFVCIRPVYGGGKYLSGRVLISRSPVIHPGDVRIVEAIGAPPPNSCFEKEELPNTVVFSVRGDRPVPSCLGGGDLDGDLYNLIPLDDPEFPYLQRFEPKIEEPATYDPCPKKMVTRKSVMEDVADFFLEYMTSDVVGIIANNWLLIADQSEHGIFDKDCQTLARLHSDAVDYPKSGQPVRVQDIPQIDFKFKPDWTASETGNDSEGYYKSQRAIGRLYRAVGPINEWRSGKMSGQIRDRITRSDILDALFKAVQARVPTFRRYTDSDERKEYLTSITQLFRHYTSELQMICISNALPDTPNNQLSEEEAVVGTIAQNVTHPPKRKYAMSKLSENTDLLARGIREVLMDDDIVEPEARLRKPWIALEFSISEDSTFGARSFGWIALGVILEEILAE